MNAIKWESAAQYTDIKYEHCEGIAKITINRPQVRNAFRPQTVSMGSFLCGYPERL